GAGGSVARGNPCSSVRFSEIGACWFDLQGLLMPAGVLSISFGKCVDMWIVYKGHVVCGLLRPTRKYRRRHRIFFGFYLLPTKARLCFGFSQYGYKKAFSF